MHAHTHAHARNCKCRHHTAARAPPALAVLRWRVVHHLHQGQPVHAGWRARRHAGVEEEERGVCLCAWAAERCTTAAMPVWVALPRWWLLALQSKLPPWAPGMRCQEEGCANEGPHLPHTGMSTSAVLLQTCPPLTTPAQASQRPCRCQRRAGAVLISVISHVVHSSCPRYLIYNV